MFISYFQSRSRTERFFESILTVWRPELPRHRRDESRIAACGRDAGRAAVVTGALMGRQVLLLGLMQE